MTSEELEKLPVSFGLMTAARAWGIGKNQAYAMARAGTFPVRVRQIGGRYKVSKFDLLTALNAPAARVPA
jgi:hypothetical protein